MVQKLTFVWGLAGVVMMTRLLFLLPGSSNKGFWGDKTFSNYEQLLIAICSAKKVAIKQYIH